MVAGLPGVGVDRCLLEAALQGERWSRVLLLLHASVKDGGIDASDFFLRPFLDDERANVRRRADERDPRTSISSWGRSPLQNKTKT